MTEQRCHFATFIIKTIRAMWAVLAAILVFVLQQANSEELLNRLTGYRLWILIALLAVAVAAFAVNFLIWRKTYVLLDGENLVVDRRTINKSRTTVKLSTIASVNLRQGLLEKIFGVYRLQMDINSAATADSTDFDLIFGKERAEAWRAVLVRAADRQPCPGPEGESGAEAEQPAIPICRFTFGQVMRHCVLSISIGSVIAAIFGFVMWFWSTGLAEGQQISWVPIAVVLFPAAYQFLRPFFTYHNFVVEKRGAHLDIAYGLITNQHFSLPLDKTNAIVIRRPALARIFDLCCGEIINVGMGDAENDQAPVFCLLTTERELYDIIAAIAPDYAPAAAPGAQRPLRRGERKALLPTMLTWGPWALLVLAAGIIFHYPVWGVIVCLLLLLAGFLQWYSSELALLPDKLSVSSGIFAKRNITVDYARLQVLSRKEGPISRRLELNKGSVNILASAAYRSSYIHYFPHQLYERIGYEMLRAAREKELNNPAR